MGYGLDLKKILKEKNIKVSTLAKLTGISPTTIYSAIDRDTSMRYDYALLISDILQIEPTCICGTVPDRKNNNNSDITILVENYNSLDSEKKARLMEYVKKLAEE